MLIGKYRLFRKIGDGSFATVKLGYHIFTQEPVAVKIVNKSTLSGQNDVAWLKQEVEVLRMLDHPGIVKLIDFIEDESAYYLVMEHCGGGELFDFIISRSRVEELLARRLFKQMILAVGYCHSKNVVHRDLKPENLLLTEANSVKLIDFGLCSVHADMPMTNRCGSACYIAPEALKSTSYYGQPADIWALGVILYALVDGSLPWNYENEREMHTQILTGDFAPPKELSPECLDLLRAILNPDPTKRITIPGILTHPWLCTLGNVFPDMRSRDPPPEPRLNLAMGGFSSSNLHQPNFRDIPRNQNRLETIYEDESVQGPIQLPRIDETPVSTRQKPVQPRSISLNTDALADSPDDGSSTHRGVILSETVSHRDPKAVAEKLENSLMSVGLFYKRISTLEFTFARGTDLHISAEVCRLHGFRNVYVVSFRRMHGDSWQYTQLVTQVLRAFKMQR